jgi:hypothetical protein
MGHDTVDGLFHPRLNGLEEEATSAEVSSLDFLLIALSAFDFSSFCKLCQENLLTVASEDFGSFDLTKDFFLDFFAGLTRCELTLYVRTSASSENETVFRSSMSSLLDCPPSAGWSPFDDLPALADWLV